jgi:hypothetical protein
MNKEIFQIAFMPYAPIQEKFKMGQYEILPFYKEAEKIILDKEVLEQAKKFFSRYVEFKLQRELKRHEEQPCQIIIITPSNYKVGQDKLLNNQTRNIVSLAHILAFSSIFEIGFSSTTSDPFQVHIQNFVKNEEGFSVWNKAYMNYNLFKVLKPLYVESSFFPFKPTDLSNALAKSLELRDSNNDIKRIFRSLELLYHTITFSDMITEEHRLLTLLMAFEVLLDFKNKHEFVESIQHYITDHKPSYFEREIFIKRNVKQFVKWPLTCWWAYDLYDLRSEIIHGEVANWRYEEYGTIWQRITFAGNLFKRIFKVLLNENGLWENNFLNSLVETYDMDEKLIEIMNEFKEMNPDIFKP